MNRYALALALLLAPSIASADSPPFAYDPSQTLSVVWDDATKTDLVEGSSTQVGSYKATDAELVTDGLTAGVRHGRVFAGVNAASVAPLTDYCVGTIGPMYFSGTVVQTEAEYLMSRPTADAGSTTIGRAIHNLRQFFGSSTTGVGSVDGLANAPAGEAVPAEIDKAAAQFIAGFVNASRGTFYPNRNSVWVLKRSGTTIVPYVDGVAGGELGKAAAERRKVWVDFAALLGRNESLTTIEELAITDATLVTDTEGLTGNLLYVEVTGGDGDACDLTGEVTTTEDQVITFSVTLNVASQ